MRIVPTLLVSLLALMSSGGALAAQCGPAPNASAASIAMGMPNSAGLYPCSNSQAAVRLGDLSPAGQQSNMQFCRSNCAYQPLTASDPQSLLIPVQCGAGLVASPRTGFTTTSGPPQFAYGSRGAPVDCSSPMSGPRGTNPIIH